MKYGKQSLDILRKLGVSSPYKGCDYIASGISLIHEYGTSYMPVTKVLYADIAKIHNTSTECVEKNIRKVIEKIWKYKNNRPIINNIFDMRYLEHKPGNVQFLSSLYRYIESGEYSNLVYNIYKDSFVYTCPSSGKPCEFCNEILCKTIHEIHNAPII